MWRLGGQLYWLRLHYTAEMQKEYGMNSVFVLVWWDAPEIGLYEFVFLCKGKLVVVLFLDIILFSVSSNSSLLISACGCTIVQTVFFLFFWFALQQVSHLSQGLCERKDSLSAELWLLQILRQREQLNHTETLRALTKTGHLFQSSRLFLQILKLMGYNFILSNVTCLKVRETLCFLIFNTSSSILTRI